jgi:hypothetical protein
VDNSVLWITLNEGGTIERRLGKGNRLQNNWFNKLCQHSEFTLPCGSIIEIFVCEPTRHTEGVWPVSRAQLGDPS